MTQCFTAFTSSANRRRKSKRASQEDHHGHERVYVMCGHMLNPTEEDKSYRAVSMSRCILATRECEQLQAQSSHSLHILHSTHWLPQGDKGTKLRKADAKSTYKYRMSPPSSTQSAPFLTNFSMYLFPLYVVKRTQASAWYRVMQCLHAHAA